MLTGAIFRGTPSPLIDTVDRPWDETLALTEGGEGNRRPTPSPRKAEQLSCPQLLSMTEAAYTRSNIPVPGLGEVRTCLQDLLLSVRVLMAQIYARFFSAVLESPMRSVSGSTWLMYLNLLVLKPALVGYACLSEGCGVHEVIG